MRKLSTDACPMELDISLVETAVISLGASSYIYISKCPWEARGYLGRLKIREVPAPDFRIYFGILPASVRLRLRSVMHWRIQALARCIYYGATFGLDKKRRVTLSSAWGV